MVVIAPSQRPGPSGPEARYRSPQRRAYVAAAIFAGFLVIASIGYRVAEGYGWLDAAYMTIITVGTVGYHVVGKVELSQVGKVWTIFVIAGGLTSGGVAMSLVVAAIVEGRVRRVLGRQHLERHIAALSDHVIVCGYGRMGSRVAASLGEAGETVVVLDKDPERTSQAEADGMLYVLGDAEEEAALTAAGIERAKIVVAALGTDADNVFLTLSARGLNTSVRVIARARDARTQDKLVKAGASRVVCPDIIGANRIVDVVVRPAMVDFVEMAHKGLELEMDSLTVAADCSMVGRTLRELSLPSRVGAMVAAVRRAAGQAVYNPGPDFTVAVGDTLVLIGRKGVASQIQQLDQPAGETTA